MGNSLGNVAFPGSGMTDRELYTTAYFSSGGKYFQFYKNYEFNVAGELPQNRLKHL